MWEYDRIEFEAQIISEIINNMNKLGKDGWDIIYYEEKKPERFGLAYNIILIVKRNINEK